jgi:hypothetical protein
MHALLDEFSSQEQPSFVLFGGSPTWTTRLHEAGNTAGRLHLDAFARFDN